jgi:F0F1-type ATP synthase membrane subunit c/vacuolar-type H+-ATPase subunit K
MSLAERYSDRVRDALLGAFMSAYVGVLVPALRSIGEPASTSSTVTTPLFVLNVIPDVLTLVGLVGSILVAGPFGLIGWGIETAGANAIANLSNPAGGVEAILLGAAITTIGALIWRWKYVLKLLIESSSGNSGRRRRRY